MKEYSRGKHNPTRGMTSEEVTNYWVSKAIERYGDKFDYSKVSLINNKKDSCIIVCREHGEMETSFANHMGSNTGCAKCGGSKCRVSKRMTFEDFLKRVNNIHPNKTFRILSRSFNTNRIKNEKVFVQDEYGICKINVSTLLKGGLPSVKSAVFKEHYLKNKYRGALGYNGLNFDKTYYTDALEYTVASCYHHGDFQTKPNWMLSNRRGCPKCGWERGIKNITSDSNKFIKKALKKFNHNRRIYNKVVYVNAKTKVEILCEVHNSYYLITPNCHLNGVGCPECATENRGYGKEDYIKQAKGRKANLYLIKCFKGDEVFYKIGISLHSLKRRYSYSNSIPYEYEKIIFKSFNAGDTWDLEKQILREFKQYKYLPSETFQGHTECFNLDLPIKEIEEKLAQLK